MYVPMSAAGLRIRWYIVMDTGAASPCTRVTGLPVLQCYYGFGGRCCYALTCVCVHVHTRACCVADHTQACSCATGYERGG